MLGSEGKGREGKGSRAELEIMSHYPDTEHPASGLPFVLDVLELEVGLCGGGGGGTACPDIQ